MLKYKTMFKEHSKLYANCAIMSVDRFYSMMKSKRLIIS